MALTAAAPDWSKLPEDLLLLIFQRLPVPDLFRSNAVCTTWSSAARELRRQRRLLHQAPWLMLHSYVDDHVGKFYSLSEKRAYTCLLPFEHPIGRVVFFGCSHGWLILADDRSDLYLLNPITGARIHDLPPAATLDYVEAVYDERGSLEGYQIEGMGRARFAPHELRRICYRKAVLSSSPSDGDYSVMVTDYSFRRLAFARAGKVKWTTIVSDTFHEDIAFHNNEFYLMTINGQVQVWDLNGNQRAAVFLSWPEPEQDLGCEDYEYLVPCPSGDLFLVTSMDIDPDSKKFRVYRVDILRKKLVGELKSLGDYAFFVNSNHSMCLSCTEFPEFTPSCIYFCTDCDQIGIYNLKDESNEYNPTVDTGECLGWLPTTWIIPSLQ